MNYKYFIILLLCVGVVEAKLFSIDNSINPGTGCSIFGCTFIGDIYMNGNTIYNATFEDASILEHDPVFTAQNMSIWSAIDDKYNSSNPAGYITAANISDGWVNITGDTMQGNLNMSDYNITDVNYLFVHNISGRSPIHIMSEVISHDTITADVFYGNIQGTNGSIYGLTITNGTISNMHVIDSAIFNTSLVPEVNNTWDLGEQNRVWRNMFVGNLFAANLSSPAIDNLYDMTSNLNASIKEPTGPYLEYDSANFWINESTLNTTINNIAKVQTLNYTVSINGPGSAISPIIGYEITQVTVIPSNSTNYRFKLTEYPGGEVIDEDRAVHSGVWNIRKAYSLNSAVNISISTSTPADNYTIIIKYQTNGVQ